VLFFNGADGNTELQSYLLVRQLIALAQQSKVRQPAGSSSMAASSRAHSWRAITTRSTPGRPLREFNDFRPVASIDRANFRRLI